MSERDLDGRPVVVTGGTGAFGSAVAGALRDHGSTRQVLFCYEKLYGRA